MVSSDEQRRQAHFRHALAQVRIAPRTDVLQGVREERRDNAPDGRVHHQAQHQQLPGLCARRHNPALPNPLTQPS